MLRTERELSRAFFVVIILQFFQGKIFIKIKWEIYTRKVLDEIDLASVDSEFNRNSFVWIVKKK